MFPWHLLQNLTEVLRRQSDVSICWECFFFNMQTLLTHQSFENLGKPDIKKNKTRTGNNFDIHEAQEEKAKCSIWAETQKQSKGQGIKSIKDIFTTQIIKSTSLLY